MEEVLQRLKDMEADAIFGDISLAASRGPLCGCSVM